MCYSRSSIHLVTLLKYCLLAALWLSASTCYAANTHLERYLYKETVGASSHVYSWKATEGKDGHIKVNVEEQNQSSVYFCTADGRTLKWQTHRGSNESVTVERQGNVLHIHGIHDGKPYDKTVQIDNRPWYQLLSISLRPYLRSTAGTTSCWMIRTDNLEVVSLKSQKQGLEDIVVNGNRASAQKVLVRANGLFAAFWHATYWYRASDKVFLRYASILGPPGTDETTVNPLRTDQ